MPAESTTEHLVAPRYLAGGGDPAWITVPLHRAFGWTPADDPLMPRVILTSPDRQTVLRLAPDPNRSWWTLHHTGGQGRPAWSMAFDAQTPVECIAALTDALASPPNRQARATHPYDYLGQTGWRRARDHDGFTSPDGHCDIEHFVSSSGNSRWYINTAISENPEGHIWRAHLHGETPPRLVDAFVRALADPAPLVRDPQQLPTRALARIRIQPRRIPLPTVTALEQRTARLLQQHAAADVASAAHRPPVPKQRRPR
ncbi:DUF317 domain-containing protein [Streptomyces sp. NPDC056149]|uniref:DUF317 domain-containing protein n=1 Tax=Streptomyces sp. NPDC056149 TaxID=3345728 RepID=UPI0035DDBBC8